VGRKEEGENRGPASSSTFSRSKIRGVDAAVRPPKVHQAERKGRKREGGGRGRIRGARAEEFAFADGEVRTGEKKEIVVGVEDDPLP